MQSLYADIPSPREFADAVDIARETMRLAVAYRIAHDRLALADVVVRAAAAFTVAEDEEASLVALENLFDAVKTYREVHENKGDERHLSESAS